MRLPCPLTPPIGTGQIPFQMAAMLYGKLRASDRLSKRGRLESRSFLNVSPQIRSDFVVFCSVFRLRLKWGLGQSP